MTADEEQKREGIEKLAAEKHRYLTESTAWAEDWAAAADRDWAAYRTDCLEVRA
eukprot:CAMPEP_0174858252 /NCGR_PEP_ID=MMETSP1114-20130205/41943_1 /TAXON_ID=312471 /ORGANISM="Neobodo designis, Strain CCAP 1951/1" /LENGTH=53 /DNA_ID=CAMNT_0016093145 /DNA_START=30 /DNA_END=188 /DNA_ORIENTATION=-